ncbi:MAG: hypothetical protein JEZ06_18510, partial [Anaerolineaceae bacterium]|nr:hypothetical protein [Anaerolineaceae bacterium]
FLVGEDFNWQLMPGTEGVIVVDGEGFVLSRDTLYLEDSASWLTFAGSAEG